MRTFVVYSTKVFYLFKWLYSIEDIRIIMVKKLFRNRFKAISKHREGV